MRKAFWDRERKLLVFWSPKCACTAVSWWFAHGLVGVERPTGGPRKWLQMNGYTLSASKAATVAKKHDVHIIAIVRHPFDRLVSCYLNKFVNYNGRPLHSFSTLEVFAKQFYLQSMTIERGYTGLSFRNFLQGIITMRGSDEDQLNIHFNVQYARELREQGIKPHRIIRVEALNEELTALNAELGIDYIPEIHNSTSYAPTSAEVAVGALSTELAALPAAPHKRAFMTLETIALAHEAHAPDYEAFGYPMLPGWAARPTPPKARSSAA